MEGKDEFYYDIGLTIGTKDEDVADDFENRMVSYASYQRMAIFPIVFEGDRCDNIQDTIVCRLKHLVPQSGNKWFIYCPELTGYTRVVAEYYDKTENGGSLWYLSAYKS